MLDTTILVKLREAKQECPDCHFGGERVDRYTLCKLCGGTDEGIVPVFRDSLWSQCKHEGLEPTQDGSLAAVEYIASECPGCKGETFSPRHYDNPLNVVGPIMKDWFFALTTLPHNRNYLLFRADPRCDEMRNPQGLETWFQRLVESCVALGWVKGE